MTDEDEDIIEDVEDTDDELNLEDETEDDTENELNLNDEDEDEEGEEGEEDGDDKDDVDESDDEDTESLIREMLQEDIDKRDERLSKIAAMQQKIDELKRQQGMD